MSKSVLVLLFLAVATAAIGVERFPPPDLGPDYIMPQSSQTPPREGWLGWMDVGVLLAALATASLIAYRWRSRRAMVWLSIFSVIYFGFYRKGCVCPIGSIQNVSQALFDSSYIVPLTVIIFFAAPIFFAIVFGRVFCGGVCPLGVLQDLVLLKPLKIPRWVDQGLGTLRYFYLGLAVLFAATGTGYLICRYDPFVAFFRMSARFPIWIWSVSMILTALFIGRPYCRYLCPYGALLGLFSRFSAKRISTTPDECITCGLCQDACDFGALRPGTRIEEESA